MALEFRGGWAIVPDSRVANLNMIRVRKDGAVGVWHKLEDGRWSAVNVLPDGRTYQEFGITKDECRRKLEARRR